MRRTLMRAALLVTLLCATWGCQTGPSEEELAELRTAPTSIPIDGHPFELNVYLSRDFQPISPADGKPLVAVVRLPEHLADVRVQQLWVLFGGEVWTSDADRVPGTQDWVARGGPRWGPGVTVDVVARLREGNGKQVLVRAIGRPIERTD
jgi:hypothetical protein